MTFADYEKDANHIALEFVQYYFNKLSSNCSKLYQLYFDDAVLKHMDHKSVPFDSVYYEYHNLDQIKKYWRSLTCLEQCKCVLLNVTALHNNDGTLVITVAGEILLKEDYENEEKIVPTKAFTQTFILQNQDRRDHYLIKSDILVFLPNVDYVDNETSEVLPEHFPSEDEKAAVVNGSAKGLEPNKKTQQEVVEQTNGTTINATTKPAEDKAIAKPSDNKDTKDAKRQITTTAATSNAGAAKSNQEAPASKKEVKAPVLVSTTTATVSTAAIADITPSSELTSTSSAKPLANTPPSHAQTTRTSVKASSTAPTNPTQTASASSIPESKQSLSSASTPASTTVISPKPSVAASSPAPAPAPTATLSAAPLVAEAGAKPKPKLAPASAPANTIPWALALKANKSSQSSSSPVASSLLQSKANPPSTSASPQQQTTQKFTTTPSTTSTQTTAATEESTSEASSKPQTYEVSVAFEQSQKDPIQKSDLKLKMVMGGIKHFDVSYFSSKGATLTFTNEEDQKNALEKGRIDCFFITKKEYHDKKDKRNKKKGPKNNNTNGANSSDGKSGGFKNSGRNNSNSGSASTNVYHNEKKN